MTLPGFILAAAAAVLWGSAGTAQTFITSQTLNPLWVGALRLIFACLFFYPLLFKSRKEQSIADNTSSKTSYFLKVLVAGTCMAMFNILFFTGVKIAGVALGSCIIIASAPVWAGTLEALFKRKMPDALWLIGIAIAIGGGIWMAVSQAGQIELNALGLGICLIAGLFYAGYSLLAKELVQITSPLHASTHAFTVAGLIALATALTLSNVPDFNPNDLLIVLYLGVIVTGFAYLLYATALKTTRVSTCVALGLLEPVTAFILAIVVVGENVNPWATVGLAAILFGLALVLKSDRKANPAESRNEPNQPSPIAQKISR